MKIAQSITRYVLTSVVRFLRFAFLREDQAKQFFQTFRQGKRYFRSKDQSSDTQIRIEWPTSMHEVFETQPLLALVQRVYKGTRGCWWAALRRYLRTDIPSLQLWTLGDDSTLLAVIKTMFLVCGTPTPASYSRYHTLS